MTQLMSYPRATVVSKIHELYETEKEKLVKDLELVPTGALTGDYWTSVANHSYFETTAHYSEEQWKLHSRALTVMKTEDRHHASVCAEQFMDVAKQWNLENKVSTDSARNIVAAMRQLPFEHLPCTAHSLQRSVCVSAE